MKDQSNPRVQAHAAAALINFTEDCPKSLLVPYLENLLEHLRIIMEAKLQEVYVAFDRTGPVFPQHRPSFSERVLFPSTVGPEGHQACPGAGGDVHRLRGGHSGGEVCAVLRQVHAVAEAHRGERRAEGAAAAARQDHRVHQSDWAGRRQGKGTPPHQLPLQSKWLSNPRICTLNTPLLSSSCPMPRQSWSSS